MSFSGYVLNGEQDNFYYMSLSRLHPQRICTTRRLSEVITSPPQHTNPCSSGTQEEELILESEAKVQSTEADSKVRLHTGFRVIFHALSFIFNKVYAPTCKFI